MTHNWLRNRRVYRKLDMAVHRPPAPAYPIWVLLVGNTTARPKRDAGVHLKQHNCRAESWLC
ncbi:EspF repeat-containing protein [Massilia rhizosphaerae]|uniref:EspF repeat-containing protein n=1 Tax=Massilia rhizosphaerae TaxID=2784389 RepID=UPI00351D7611